jgi:four helix bundle protein
MGTEARRHGPEKLRCYDLALQWATSLEELAPTLRCRASLRDQLLRTVDSVVLNTAEGAGHQSRGQKVKHYRIALASATEAMAALARMQPLNPAINLHKYRRTADMICVLLAALIRTHQPRT